MWIGMLGLLHLGITIDIVAPTAFVESTLMRIGARRRPATRCYLLA